MKQLRELEPTPLWNFFADLNAVPRPSKKEGRAVEFIQNFGRSLGLEVRADDTGNVIIKKGATPGREGRPTVALQSHLDMVHQKNAGTRFDFDRQGIEMKVDGDWVKAQGTTLGADNGIGVAAAMAVLASKDLAHPPLEALFTVDEETGMTGAKNLASGLLQARYLLNLDTEDDQVLTIGCAGGVDIVGSRSLTTEPAPSGYAFLKLTVDGLTGGHSGMDIHRGRANVNKLMNRLLFGAVRDHRARVAWIDGGSLRNAIPREATAVIAVPDPEAVKARVVQEADRIRDEYRSTDPACRVRCEDEVASDVLEPELTDQLLRVVYTIPHGIHRMSPEVAGLVQTSNNLARVLAREGQLSLQCLCRGSVDSEKDDLATAVACAMELVEAEVRRSGQYPGWAPRPDSEIVKLMSGLYRELFKEEPDVEACHAGLECGILGSRYPELEMISFGPNIRGAHSPDETVQVSSVQKFWRYLTTTLERI